uniref:Amino acid transporter transmembrane domain-containing protein n=1 Tax=Timema cristinae TaxID=61476 RepID=A0A7R9CBQ7_TIMCR|nr:unnamed protein product [Timema cristinae]
MYVELTKNGLDHRKKYKHPNIVRRKSGQFRFKGKLPSVDSTGILTPISQSSATLSNKRVTPYTIWPVRRRRRSFGPSPEMQSGHRDPRYASCLQERRHSVRFCDHRPHRRRVHPLRAYTGELLKVKSSHILCRRQKIPSLTYAQTAELAFLSGPPSLQRFSSLSRIFASVMMALTYFCSLCVYLVFVATSIKQLADHYYQEGTPEEDTLNIRFYILMLAPFVYALGMITNLKFLVPFSAAANLLMMTGFAITLYYMFKDIPPVENHPYIAAADEIPIFFSTVIFAMEGIGVVMPLENSMKNPSHFLGCPGVLNTSMTIVTFMYTLVGLAGYLKYGDDTAASITLNLPIRPAISLVGAICFSTLGLLSPAVIETATCWEHDLGRWNWLLWKNLLIIIFSLMALTTGTYKMTQAPWYIS